MTSQESEDTDKPLTFLQVMFSSLASAFGVQTADNRKRDFERGKPTHFIISRIVFTVVFVALMLLIVSTVVSNLT